MIIIIIINILNSWVIFFPGFFDEQKDVKISIYLK